MSKDNPREHQVKITFAQSPGMKFKIWSYQEGTDREFQVALVGSDTHTIAQGKFRTRSRKGRHA